MYEMNLTDKEFQKTLIDSRDDSMYLIPMYVIVCNKKYSILDIDKIKDRVSETLFKVGFGTSHSIISKPNNFPTALFYNFNVTPLFTDTNAETDISTNYFVLEESVFDDVESEENPVLAKIYEEINSWIQRLYDMYRECIENNTQTETAVEEEEEPVDRPYYDMYDDPDYFD